MAGELKVAGGVAALLLLLLLQRRLSMMRRSPKLWKDSEKLLLICAMEGARKPVAAVPRKASTDFTGVHLKPSLPVVALPKSLYFSARSAACSSRLCSTGRLSSPKAAKVLRLPLAPLATRPT